MDYRDLTLGCTREKKIFASLFLHNRETDLCVNNLFFLIPLCCVMVIGLLCFLIPPSSHKENKG